MIARNEVDCIGNAIRSCQAVVDEIVVVDTGSTDGTVEAATALGARVFHQPWADSFSKPRNLAMEQVKTRWVLVLDCDETLAHTSQQELLRLCEQASSDAYLINWRVHSQSATSVTKVLRLGRVDQQLPRFYNRIHERIKPEYKSVADSGIVIDHFGYIYKSREQKTGLYNRLLELELEDRPNDNYVPLCLLHNYWAERNDRWRTMLPIAAATLNVNAAKPPHAMAAVLLEVLLQLRAEDLAGPVSQAQADTLAARWFPASLPLLAKRAGWHLHNGRLAVAEGMAREGLERWQSKRLSSDIAFMPEKVLNNLHCILADICRATRRILESKFHLESARRVLVGTTQAQPPMAHSQPNRVQPA